MKGKDIKNDPTKDQLIVDYIKDQLEEKMQASAMDINVTCRDGSVHLSGFVDVLAEKKMAETVARDIDGVKKVENNLTIGMDSNITDKHIELEVINKFRTVRNADRITGVGVKVNNGVVSLIGQVDTLNDAHMAMKLASQVRGVKDVVNNTEIRKAGYYDDVNINNKIRQELSKINISSEDIACDVIGGKVTLSGFVENRREVEIAKEIAMGVEGVTKVFNRIKVRK